MKKIILLFFMLFATISKMEAQFVLQYKDTTIDLGDNLILGVANQPSSTGVMVDDNFSDKIDLGFSFEYFGNSYSKCVVSGNNFLSFDTTLANTYCNYVYSAALNAGQLNKAILFPMQDLIPTGGGSVALQKVGIAPHRKFIISVCRVPLYGCNTLLVTDQLILNEGSNVIEMYITMKPSGCTTIDNGTAIQGLKYNTTQIYVSGRDIPQTQWSAVNDAKVFTPSGTGSYSISSPTFQPWHFIDSLNLTHIKWYDENNVYLGEGQTIPVTPGVNTHFYTARFNDIIGCDVSAYEYIDTVYVTVNDTTTTPPPTSIGPFPGIEKSVFTYPNPTLSNSLTLEFNSNISLESLSLLNMSGRKIWIDYNKISDGKYFLKFRKINSGIYYLLIKTDKGIVRRKVEIINP